MENLSVRPFNSASVLRPSGLLPFSLADIAGKLPLDLEIGCGVGWHPIRYAQENPKRFLIAIEHTREKFMKFSGRVGRHAPLPNLLPVHADAVAWVTHFLPPHSLSRCLILYPNPNPKAPSRRWIRMPFMHQLLKALRPEGELVIVTNEKSYADEVRLYARDFWKLAVLEDRVFTQADVVLTRARTHFEKKYLARGETCFELRLTQHPKLS